MSESKHAFFLNITYLRPSCVSFSVNPDYSLHPFSRGLVLFVFSLLIYRKIFYIRDIIALPNVYQTLLPGV